MTSGKALLQTAAILALAANSLAVAYRAIHFAGDQECSLDSSAGCAVNDAMVATAATAAVVAVVAAEAVDVTAAATLTVDMSMAAT